MTETNSPTGEPCREPIGIGMSPIYCEDPSVGTCAEKGCGLKLCEFHMTKHKFRHERLNELKQVKKQTTTRLTQKKEDEFY